MRTFPDFAEAIKMRVSMREVAEQYGFEMSPRSRKMCCPFHNDKKPSMQIYAGSGGWFCFVCNEGGDVIDFVQRYFGLGFMDAQKKLNDDFRLGLPIGERLSDQENRRLSEAQRERERIRQAQKAREQYLLTVYYAAYDRYVSLDMMMIENSPKNKLSKEISQEYIYASKRIDEAWYAVQQAADAIREFDEEKKGNRKV